LLQRAIAESILHLRPWMPWAHDEPETLEAKIERLRRFRGAFDLRQDFVYGIFDSTESTVLGGTGLHTRAGEGAREIGYWIHAAHVRNGYATEAVAALTRVAFEIDRVERVEIKCDPQNRPSAAVPERIGFRLESVGRQDAIGVDGQPRDTMIWSMTPKQFLASRARAAAFKAFDAFGRGIAPELTAE
jgi:RimJ/RimL family protein N-acetyltransferase